MSFNQRVQIYVVIFTMPRTFYAQALNAYRDVRMELIFYKDLGCSVRLVAEGIYYLTIYDFDLRPVLMGLFGQAPAISNRPANTLVNSDIPSGPDADHPPLTDAVKKKQPKGDQHV